MSDVEILPIPTVRSWTYHFTTDDPWSDDAEPLCVKSGLPWPDRGAFTLVHSGVTCQDCLELMHA